MNDLGGVLIATLLPVISIWLAAWPAYPIAQNRARLRFLRRQFATVITRASTLAGPGERAMSRSFEQCLQTGITRKPVRRSGCVIVCIPNLLTEGVWLFQRPDK